MKIKLSRIFAAAVILILIQVSGYAQSEKQQQSESGNQVYFLVTYDITDKWADVWIEQDGSIGSSSPEQMSIVQAHFAYMGKLHQSGKIVSGGPLLESAGYQQKKSVNGAMFIYKTSAREDADAYIKDDPYISSGIMQVKSVRPFIAGIPF